MNTALGLVWTQDNIVQTSFSASIEVLNKVDFTIDVRWDVKTLTAKNFISGVNEVQILTFQTKALSWPSGADGALVISSGETVFLPAGSVKDYSSIQIDASGELRIEEGSAWTIIGCAGNCAINGDVYAVSNPSDGTFTATAPDGTALSYTVTCGAGGVGGDTGGGSVGGNASQGNGGGGAGYDNGHNATSVAGNGGDGFQTSGSPIGGVGGSDHDSNFDGSNGDDANSTLGDADGAGGGGGYRGYNGQGLYMKIGGTCSGTGTVWVGGIGMDGGLGGGGGNAETSTASGYGGGGGGGAGGGQGGKAITKYHVNTPTWTINIGGGVAANGGSGGTGLGAVDSNDGFQGDPGIDGASGSKTSTSY